MVKKNNTNTKNAFTLVEMLIAFSLLGFLFVMTITNISNIAPDPNKARLKKGYVDLENTVHAMITNEVLYPNNEGFKNLNQIIFKGTGETIGFSGPTHKFRDAFKYTMSVVKDKLNCELYSGTTSETGCFMSESGVVYGIPETDFETIGVVNDAEVGKLVPIVLYPRFTEGQSLDKFGFIIGVRADGKIKILYTADCDDEDEKDQYIQCKTVEYLKSETIKTMD